MKIAVYKDTLDNRIHKHGKKYQILEQICQGFLKSGCEVEVVENANEPFNKWMVIKADIHLFLGTPKLYTELPLKNHELARNTVWAFSQNRGFQNLIVESKTISRVLGMYNKLRLEKTYRLSFNHWQPNLGYFGPLKQKDSSRFMRFCNQYNILPEESKHQGGDHFLVIAQVRNDPSSGNQDQTFWAAQQCASIRRYSNKKIVVRPHPKDLAWNTVKFLHQVKNYKNIEVGTRSFDEDLRDSEAVFASTSTSTIMSNWLNIPTVSNINSLTSFSDIPDISSYFAGQRVDQTNRQYMFNRLAFTEWSVSEITNGIWFNWIKDDLERYIKENNV